MMCQFKWERMRDRLRETSLPSLCWLFQLSGSKILRLLKIDQVKNEEQSSWWSWYVLGKRVRGQQESQEEGGRSLFSNYFHAYHVLLLLVDHTERKKWKIRKTEEGGSWYKKHFGRIFMKFLWPTKVAFSVLFLFLFDHHNYYHVLCSLYFFHDHRHSFAVQGKSGKTRERTWHQPQRMKSVISILSLSFSLSLKHKFVSREKSVYLLFCFMYGFVTHKLLSQVTPVLFCVSTVVFSNDIPKLEFVSWIPWFHYRNPRVY